MPVKPPRGRLFVVAAPSGTGKSSLVRALISGDAGILASVSHTTRMKRGSEQEGREYHFVDDASFDSMIEAGAFLEWARVHGHRYGTSRHAVQAALEAGRDVILEIDWQGALQIRGLFPHAVLVFVMPPSFEELRARLTRRGEDSSEAIDLRLANARGEIGHAHQFDYVIINRVFGDACADLQAIVRAQRLTYDAQRAQLPAALRALCPDPASHGAQRS